MNKKIWPVEKIRKNYLSLALPWDVRSDWRFLSNRKEFAYPHSLEKRYGKKIEVKRLDDIFYKCFWTKKEAIQYCIRYNKCTIKNLADDLTKTYVRHYEKALDVHEYMEELEK